MSANLEIRDGVPHWWNSPDIWVVPGNDPNGVAGQPIAGEPAFVWGRVRNTGNQTATGARVSFYWSNPAAGVLRSNSTPIGSAFVDLNPGDSKEVLCLVPWIPVVVNGGHECVVAEVIHPGDPMPSPLPDDFAPPTFHQVAQKNLNVLVVMKMMMSQSIQLAAPKRVQRLLRVALEFGGNLDKDALRQIGLKGYREADNVIPLAGLSNEAGCEEPKSNRLQKELQVDLKPGSAKAVHLKVWPTTLKPRTYVLLHVISREGDKTVGGVTYVLVSGKEQ